MFQQITRPADDKPKEAGFRRLAEAMFDKVETQSRREEKPDTLELDATFTASADEVLRTKDFEQMTVAEQAQAKGRSPPAPPPARGPDPPLPAGSWRAHRYAAHLKARCAPAAMSSILSGASRKMREPPLVVLCDISGSCSNYSRMFLHFLHALINDRERVRYSCSARD